MNLRGISAAMAALLFVGCAPPGSYRKVRSSIRTLAVKELGPADRYDVKTSRDNFDRLMKGLIARVEVHGFNVRPAPGYVLDEVFVSARNVRVNRHKRRVESAEQTSAKAFVSNESLAKMVAIEGSVLEPRVEITPDFVRISGNYKAFGAIPVSIVATGKAHVIGSAGVEFASESVTAGGLPTPFNIQRTFDFSKIYPALVLTGVSTEEGKAVLTGTLDWSKIKHE